jgi:hypothetical protein
MKPCGFGQAALNGFTSTLCGPLRVCGPALTAPLFAWSLIEGARIGFPFDRSLIFLIFGGAQLMALYLVCQLPTTIEHPASD